MVKTAAKSGSNRKQQTFSEDEPAPQSRKTRKKKVDNEDKVHDIVDSLRSKYGSKFTVLRLHIWAELISRGLYSSTDDSLCNNLMFQRAGGGSSKKKSYQSELQPHSDKTALPPTYS